MTATSDNEPRRVVDLAYVKACLERWARWSVGAGGGREISLTGRLMEGLKSNTCPGWLDDRQAGKAHDPWCPLCGGKGRLKLELRPKRRTRRMRCSICDPDGKFLGDWCWRCHGSRVIEIVELEVNPASIKSTRSVGGHNPADPVCIAIDELVGAWRERDETVWLHRVLVAEYFRPGTQKLKAQRLKVSYRFYKYRLQEAHAAVEALLRTV